MSTSTAAHRDDSHRKSRAVRLGAILLAVVGVTAAATSAGFSNDAWFSANASSADVSLQGKLSDSDNWEDADTDDNTVEVEIPEATFKDMVPGDSRTVTVQLRNAGSTTLNLADKPVTEGAILDSDNTTVSVSLGVTSLGPNATTTATITIAPKVDVWTEKATSLQNAKGTLTVDFTGTTVVASDN